MKHFRWIDAAALSTAIFMGLALNSCSNEENFIIPNDDFSEVQSALSSAKITKGAVSIRKGPGPWYDRIGGLYYGKTVDVIKEQAGWLNVKYGDTEGWIYRPDTDFVSTNKAAGCTPEIADFIRDNYPDGYNIIFAYNGPKERDVDEFHRQAKKFSKEYHTLNVANDVLDKDIFRAVETYDKLKNGISETGLAVVQCLADHPRDGFDDSKCSQIKNLSIMAHGDTNNVDLGKSVFKTDDIPDFSSNTYGYLNNHLLGIQLYACHTARAPNTPQNWFERYYEGKDGGVVKQEDTFQNGKGSFAQTLSAAMGPDATVFGHTTRGHLSNNYAARCYGKLADGAVHGKHMFDIYFPQTFVVEEAKRIGKTEDETRTLMYTFYRGDGVFAGDNKGRDTLIDPESKGKNLRAQWVNRNP